MAAPITHLVLALKILSLLPGTIDKKEFIIGTSFPDIRYFAKLERKTTHIEPVSWNAIITEPSSFRAGMLFHNLVDILRIQYFEPNFYDLYNRFALSQYSRIYANLYPLIMKLSEDTILYNTIDCWDEIISYFDTICSEELTLCPYENLVRCWHNLIQEYCSKKPSVDTFNSMLTRIGNLNLDECHEQFNAVELFAILANNQNFQEKIKEFYAQFETLLSDELLVTPPNSY